MQLPLAFLDPAAIEEVSIEVWKEVFDIEGWPQSLGGRKTSFTHEDIHNSLSKDPPTEGLLLALEALEGLGTEAGREAIASAIQDRGLPPGTLPADKGERDFAMNFYIAQRKNPLLADAFARAQIQVQESGNQRRYNEFVGKRPGSIKKVKEKKAALQEEVLTFCIKSDLGDHVNVEMVEDDGTYIFKILRSHRMQKPLAVVPGSAARATLRFRPVHGDVIHYDAATGRLRIFARASSIVQVYVEALGKALFNDAAFFCGSDVCTLRAIQDRGREALENHGIYGIGRIWMTECLWERGDRELFQIRSNDCFRSMDDLHLPISEGRLLQAKLKCEVIQKSTRPVTVTIRVPSRIEVSQKKHEALIDQVLEAVGIRNSATVPEQADLWALSPWRHPSDVWRILFGPELDRLVRERVLIPVQLSAAAHPSHPGAGLILQAKETAPGDYYGVSDVPEIASRSLTATDLDGLELQPEQLRRFLCERIGTDGGAAWDGGELLELGFITLGEHHIFLVFALAQPRPGIGDRLRARAEDASILVLFPSTKADGGELSCLKLETPLPTKALVLRKGAFACGIANLIPAIHIAPDAARLVVDTRFGKIWVNGVELVDLPQDSHAFRFMALMARSKEPVSHDAIVQELSQYRQDLDAVARQAKNKARQIISKSLAAAGKSFGDDPFPSAGKGCYRCALTPYVR